ncbi:unnamed protein product [Caenorhabditis angaria]|uniref:Uncharacterized protein n=1 Tax=Caenorhabditis angaria TaxID=860376 RepID=A0A9P1IEI0_9PELO|nr:unnamed protein product [Caenorhabditis angaria]
MKWITTTYTNDKYTKRDITILLGAPVTASPKEWAKVCKVVSGRVINGYCETDWLLRFLYRTMSVQFRISGTGPVENQTNKKIYIYNLSHIVKGHMDYSSRLTEVLEAVGVKTGKFVDANLNYEEAEEAKEEKSAQEEN